MPHRCVCGTCGFEMPDVILTSGLQILASEQVEAEIAQLKARIAELTTRDCPKCEGFGIYSEPKCLGRSRPAKCSLCDGTGKVTG